VHQKIRAVHFSYASRQHELHHTWLHCGILDSMGPSYSSKICTAGGCGAVDEDIQILALPCRETCVQVRASLPWDSSCSQGTFFAGAVATTH
jgi:hypothetical protein